MSTEKSTVCEYTLKELTAKIASNKMVLNLCKNSSETEQFSLVEFELISLVFG